MKDRSGLKKVISARLDLILQNETGEPDDELKQIFKVIKGASYYDMVEEEFEIIKFEMQSMFEQYGVDLDLDELQGDMTAEDMIRKMKEMTDKIGEQYQQKAAKRKLYKKSKKQQEKEERVKQIEEVRKKNISSIYKQLAKVLHPDLEQDEEIKLEKEELMKKLTTAYENNDLHALLTLELSWIQKEENHAGKLAESKLGIYNEVLKDQVKELEIEIENTLHHPRYHPLHRFVMFPIQMEYIDMIREKQQIEEMKNSLVNSAAMLRNPKQARPMVKAIIHDF